ncbi:ABC transporter permease, partial [Aeromonas hydrophila]
LTGIYFTVVLPFIYRALVNNGQGVSLKELMNAARRLGERGARACLLVVIPCLRKRLLAVLFLSLAFLLGECVFAARLVGTRYET